MSLNIQKQLLISGLIFLVTFIVYFNSLNNKFIYDDEGLVVENKYIRSWGNIPQIFSTDMWSLVFPTMNTDKVNEWEKFICYRPLPVVSFLIDNSVWGLKPFGFHLTNTLFHAANGTLVFIIINFLTGNWYVAAASGLLFVTHPVQTESVAFISSRGEVLFLFFLLLTVLYFAYGKMPFSLIFYSLALISKETSLITPALLFLVSWYFLREKLKLKYFIPFLIITAFYYILRSFVLPPIQHYGPFLDSLNRFAFIMSRGAAIYLKILFFPVTLCVDYYLKYPVSISEFFSIFSIALNLLLVIFAFFAMRRFKTMSFSILWFYAGLIPASHILYPLPYLIAERHLYLPSIGFCVLVAWALVKISQKYKKIAVTLFVAILVLFSIRTIYRNFDWGDDILLWGKDIKQFPDDPKAHVNIAYAYIEKGDIEKAIEHYKQVLSIYPLATDIHRDLGNIYLKTGKLDEALKEYLLEKDIDPQKPEPYNRAGIVFARQKCFRMAEKYFELALQIDPQYENARKNLQLLKKDISIETQKRKKGASGN